MPDKKEKDNLFTGFGLNTHNLIPALLLNLACCILIFFVYWNAL